MLRSAGEIESIFIHCAATPNGRHFTILDVDDWHGARGFRRHDAIRDIHRPHLEHVGYHAVINLDGSVALGRDPFECGAHVSGHNRTSMGVCVIGTDKFTVPQWNVLREVVRGWVDDFRIKQIRGHNEVSAKSCPGFRVCDWTTGGMRPLEDHILIP
jgi:hypothetical protein